MNELIRGIRAEVLKMRHTFLYPFYAAVPILGSTVFLLYYRFAGRSEQAQAAGYAEVIGIALPFVISVVCAGNIGLEEQNHFQVFLGSYVNRRKEFWIKWLVLLGLGFLAISGAVAFFGAGYHFVLGKEGISAGAYMGLVMVLFAGSMPLCLEHLFLNLMFSRTVSQCAGAAEFLLSALFLTGLGDGRWQFFPCTWSARGAALLLNRAAQRETGGIGFVEIKGTVVICLLLSFLMCVIIEVWFRFFEGRQCSD